MIAWIRLLPAAACGAAALIGLTFLPRAQAKDVLVADRLSNSVYRYSETGDFLGVVLTDNVNIDWPVGMALSPDLTSLYIASAQNSRLIRYDYDYAAGTADNPAILAEGLDDGLAFPNAILFEPDGSKLYVANLDPRIEVDEENNVTYHNMGIAQFYPDGSSAGPSLDNLIGDGTMLSWSGMTWGPNQELLVNGFLDFPGGTKGMVAKANQAKTELNDFIDLSPSLAGASGLLVHGDYLYVSGMFASNIQRFDVNTGAVDPSFFVGGLAFPQGLVASPDGNGFLAGILGYANGQGHIAHYDYDGQLVGDGVFASHGGGGFTEATVFIVEPKLPGDFNGDRMVNGADLDDSVRGWKARFGVDLDGNDFLVWQRNLTASPNPEAFPVPEPHSARLAILMLVGASCRRFNRITT